jgi:hypothetical protein
MHLFQHRLRCHPEGQGVVFFIERPKKKKERLDFFSLIGKKQKILCHGKQFFSYKKYTIVKCGRIISQIVTSDISKVKMLRGHKHVENGFPFILFDISMSK